MRPRSSDFQAHLIILPIDSLEGWTAIYLLRTILERQDLIHDLDLDQMYYEHQIMRSSLCDETLNEHVRLV